MPSPFEEGSNLPDRLLLIRGGDVVGPGDENQAHAPNEITRVDDLEKCAAFHAGLPSALEKRT